MSGPRTSILTTIYNRPRRVLRNTFHQLRRNDLRNTELIVVDDASTKNYDDMKSYLTQYEVPFTWIRIDTKKDRPETYQINQGYNNPAYAWNTALDAARGDIICTLSSDCMIPPHGLNHARRCGDGIWASTVIDIDRGTVLLGKARICPYGWFMSWKRSSAQDVRWDEQYLKGMAFEDNDFTARLMLHVGQFTIDQSITSFHQSHPPVAYSDGHLGHDINERYTYKKWGGMPWLGDAKDPLRWTLGYKQENIVVKVDRKVERVAS